MTNPYDRRATAIDARGSEQLSAFWRQRLTMLLPTNQGSPVLSRRNLMRLIATAVLVGALPTFHAAPAVAEQEKVPQEKGKGQGTSAGSIAADGSTLLMDAIKDINDQAAKLPESRAQTPLTEDEVVHCIEKFPRPIPVPGDLDVHLKTLSDEEFRGLKSVVTTRRLPKDIILRQFVRYNDGTGVEHGWWVRLILMRQHKCPYSLTLRQEATFRRPYSQKERQFQDDVRETGSFPTIGRLVAYFDDDPQLGKVQQFSKDEADKLAAAVKKAIQEKKSIDLLKTYWWEKVDKETRAWIGKEAKSLAQRPLRAVSVSPRQFAGRLMHWQGFETWDPNLPVLGYVVVEFADKGLPNPICLEFGHAKDGARLVNYIVSRDDFPRLKGKPLPKMLVQAFNLPSLKDSEFDFYTQIDNAPDELPGLRNVNLELWKLILPGAK